MVFFFQALEYSESHACLKVKLPRHLLLRSDPLSPPRPPPSDWSALDSAFAGVFVNKTTGGFVCPEMAISGDWKTLQSFLLTWHRNRATKKGEAQEEYPALKVRHTTVVHNC